MPHNDSQHHQSFPYSKAIWWIIASVAVVRIIYVVLFPFDLSGDEAYYWDWGRRLSWGYFSKPPFIAWLMALAGWLGGNTDTGVRLMAVALGTGSLAFVYCLSRQMFSAKAAFWAVLLMLASPGNVAVNLILTIDAPLMFFWSGALLFFYNQIHNRRYSKLWWVLTTLFLGFGLLSKQMMVAFYPMAALYLAWVPENRKFLKHWAIWASWIISMGFMIPTLIWNAQNDWITVSHTQHHFEGKSFSILDVLSRIGEFLGSQLGVLSPVSGVAIVVLLVLCLKHFKKLSPNAKYLMAFAAPGLLLVTFMLLRQGINPNWPAVFYVSMVILLGATVANENNTIDNARKLLVAWRKPALWCGAIMAVLVTLLPFIMDWTHQTGAKWDPVVRLQGWTQLAEKVQKARDMNREDMNDPFILATGHRYTTSHLAFYLVDQPRVYHWPKEPGAIESQYELWGFDQELEGRDALIVVPGKEANPPESVYEVFDTISFIEGIQVNRSAKRTRDYTLYIGRGLKLSSSQP